MNENPIPPLDLPGLQQWAISRYLSLNSTDALRINERLTKEWASGITRVPLLVVIKFDSGETRIERNMSTFIQSFAEVRHGAREDIREDTLSVLLLDDEEPYRQCCRILNHLKEIGQGIIISTRPVTGVYKRSPHILKRLAHMFESYEKHYTEIRIIADLQLTGNRLKEPINHMRLQLLSSQRSRPEPPVEEEANNAESASSSSSEEDVVISTEAPVVVGEAIQLKKLYSTGSSSSSKSTTSTSKKPGFVSIPSRVSHLSENGLPGARMLVRSSTSGSISGHTTKR